MRMKVSFNKFKAYSISVLQPLEENASVRCGPDEEIKASGIGERPKIPVSGKETSPAIDAALGDQGIAEAGLAALRQHLRS